MSPESSTALIQQLLTAEAEGGEGAAGVLAQHPNPTVRLLGELWSRRRAAGEETAEEEPIPRLPEAVADEGGELLRLRRRIERLRRRLGRASEEVRELRARNDTLAAALGACYLCWGENPACEECAGTGCPGAAAPHPDPFEQYVVPTLERVRTSRRGRTFRPPGAAPPVEIQPQEPPQADPKGASE